MTQSFSGTTGLILLTLAGAFLAIFAALTVAEIQRLGTAQWSFVVGIAGFCLPYALKWIYNKSEEYNATIKEIKDSIKELKETLDARVDTLEKQLPSALTAVQENKTSVASLNLSLESLKAEIYAARAESQAGEKIATTGFNQAQKALDAINYVLNSGALIQFSQTLTGLNLEVAVIRTQLERQGLLDSKPRLRNQGQDINREPEHPLS
jgi:cell division protein ZapA (FtsZ GTPase activity inhibitor)